MDTMSEGRKAVRYDVGDHEDRPWGNWRVVDTGTAFITKRVEVNAGQRLSLQLHQHRSEHWVIVAGSGEATVDDSKIPVGPGDYVVIPCGAKHRIHNNGAEPLIFVEVQYGGILDESDITRLEDDYSRD
ncbi:MAG: phosphomannose isomerase type II C-terminal cupin domain [Kiloniellaceae bacterium]